MQEVTLMERFGLTRCELREAPDRLVGDMLLVIAAEREAQKAK